MQKKSEKYIILENMYLSNTLKRPPTPPFSVLQNDSIIASSRFGQLFGEMSSLTNERRRILP